MRIVSSLALLCLFFQQTGSAKGQQTGAIQPETHYQKTENDSTFSERLKAKIANKQSFYTFETGITSGPNFKPGSYLAFEYTKKSTGRVQTGFFMSYSVYQLQNSVDYNTQFTNLERSSIFGNEETRTYETRIIDYQIDRLNLTEIGVSAKYTIGQKTTLRAMGTFVVQQSIWGDYTDHTFDSTFKIVDGVSTLSRAYDNNRNSGNFRRTNSSEDVGLENYFFLHAGIDYRISKRTCITTKVGMPINQIFPNKIGYDHYGGDHNIELDKSTTDFPKRPAFVKVGLSVTL